MGVGAGLRRRQLCATGSGLEMDKDGNPPPEAIGPLVGFGIGMVVANVGVLVAASKQNEGQRTTQNGYRKSQPWSDPSPHARAMVADSRSHRPRAPTLGAASNQRFTL